MRIIPAPATALAADPDCNHVSLSLSDPNVTIRCAMKEGHGVGGHNLRGEVMSHKHRKPVATDTDQFRRPLGGKHKAGVPGSVRAVNELLRRLDEAMGVAR